MEDGPPSFPRDFSCPRVLRDKVQRDRTISRTGVSPSMPPHSMGILLSIDFLTLRRCCSSTQPCPTTPTQQRLQAYTGSVWAIPRSLATTRGVSFDFLSCGYLDVSVPRVGSVETVTSHYRGRVAPFGYLRVIACLPANRSLSQAPTPFIAS